MKDDRLKVFSYSSGTQTNSIAVLINKGVIEKPDIAIMVDTEREDSRAIDYAKNYGANLLSDVGVDLVIVKKSKWATYDIFGADDDFPLPGYFSEWDGRQKNGDCKGKQPSFCSIKWKTEVIHRELNNRYGEKELTERGVTSLMGITIEEQRRMKFPQGKWQREYPLADMHITRQAAIQIVTTAGLPKPPRSLCWMCPNRDCNMWVDLKENSPEDFNKAVEHEKYLREEKGLDHLYLHKQGVPLDKVKFKPQGFNEQQDIFAECSGLCGL